MVVSATALQNRRVLVVEDDYLVAQIVTDFLEDAGANVIGQIGRVDEAVAFIHQNGATIDCAVVDLNLHGQKSYPVADALAANGITFVFATGYDSEVVGASYGKHPRCEKPFSQDTLVAALVAIGR
jgi:DNA-binding response OmpR family regulator